MLLLFNCFFKTAFQSNEEVFHYHHQHFQLTHIKEQGGKGIVQDEVTEVRVEGDAAH